MKFKVCPGAASSYFLLLLHLYSLFGKLNLHKIGDKKLMQVVLCMANKKQNELIYFIIVFLAGCIEALYFCYKLSVLQFGVCVFISRASMSSIAIL